MGLFKSKGDPEKEAKRQDLAELSPEEAVKNLPVTSIAIILGAISSMGGLISGYESGEISGFQQQTDFLRRFGQNMALSNVRAGTIVGLFSIGNLIGCLASAWICDRIGRRLTICCAAFFYIIGVIIEISSEHVWVQFAMGRFVAGMGTGACSTSVPMYQSESIPKNIRGTVVASYQLLLTIGIWLGYMVNYGTSQNYTNSAQWRIPVGIAFIWPLILGVAIIFMPESPRFAYRKGRTDEARRTFSRLMGVPYDSPLIDAEINEIEEKLQAERSGGDLPWYDCFKGPRMMYRIVLGMVLQAGQQLTGVNYFFYFGTTVFKSTGLSNSYVTQIILGSVNVASTFFGLWVVQNCGRRKSLIAGAGVMVVCFFIYSFVGHFELGAGQNNSGAGSALIVFTCICIVAFATTWGPLVWAIVGELYPARYRAVCMALATAANWIWNFLISFFTTFITGDIGYWYGMVFAGCCVGLMFIVYFCVIESWGRSLEEIDTMYLLHVYPPNSAKWRPTEESAKHAGTNGFFASESETDHHETATPEATAA